MTDAAATRTLGPRGLLVAEAMATGVWLGLTQVSLAFALMSGSGGAATMFFLLTGVWIAGGAVGVSRGLVGSTTTSLGVALAAFAVARVTLELLAFSAVGTVVALAAGAVIGAYSGAYFRDRSRRWGAVRPLLFHENNGFVAGYLLASAALFVSRDLLDWGSVVVGGGLVVVGWCVARRRGSD